MITDKVMGKTQQFIINEIEMYDKFIDISDNDSFLKSIRRRSRKLSNYSNKEVAEYFIKKEICFNLKGTFTNPEKKYNFNYLMLTKNNYNELLLSSMFFPKHFFSFYTAAYVHGLTLNVPRSIYVRQENLKKLPDDREKILFDQKIVDKSFTKNPRISNTNVDFFFNNREYKIIKTETQNMDSIGIEQFHYFGNELEVTSIERTLIDISVHPHYSGGPGEVLKIFKNAKNKINCVTMAEIFNKYNLKYPYERRILFYMKRTGYDRSSVKEFEENVKKNKNLELKFYLNNQITQPKLDEKLDIYYPSYIDNITEDQ
ncbi:hypothetical protein PT189_08755 [Erysipelothrix rhusiopathiae]|nr:hypothetical protein [Erysipelothrix rhusiopathiae]